jgi:hypothetical protein
MRSCSKERTNIPITISVLHDQEYQLYRLLHRSGRRRAFTERHVELEPRLQRGMDPLFGEQNILTSFQWGMDPLSERQSMLPRLQRVMDRKTTTARSKGQQDASTQMIRQEADA